MVWHYVQNHPDDGMGVLMDLVQAGNLAMVEVLDKALYARNVIGYLKVVARYAINLAWIEDRLIPVCRSSYMKGKRAPLTVSLTTPLYSDSSTTLLDVLECADWQSAYQPFERVEVYA